jgi:phage protein U
VGRRPALQFTGPGEEHLTLEGTIYPHYTGGLGQIRGMRAQAQAGAPMMMVSGLGDVYGLWVITSVRDTESFFMAGGLPRKVEFTLELSAYGPDGVRLGGGLF